MQNLDVGPCASACPLLTSSPLAEQVSWHDGDLRASGIRIRFCSAVWWRGTIHLINLMHAEANRDRIPGLSETCLTRCYLDQAHGLGHRPGERSLIIGLCPGARGALPRPLSAATKQKRGDCRDHHTHASPRRPHRSIPVSRLFRRGHAASSERCLGTGGCLPRRSLTREQDSPSPDVVCAVSSRVLQPAICAWPAWTAAEALVLWPASQRPSSSTQQSQPTG